MFFTLLSFSFSLNLDPDTSQHFQDVSCNGYLCKLDSQTFQRDTCQFFSQGTYYLSICSDGYYCPTSASSNNASCTWSTNPYSTEAYANVGEPCNYDTDCKFSATCQETEGRKLCVKSILDQSCGGDQNNCEPGTYCDSGQICSQQLQIGSTTKCYNDQYCVNGAVCDLTQNDGGTCKAAYSIEAGQAIGFCDSSNPTKTVCASGLCWDKGNNEYVCASALKSKNTLPTTCVNDQECPSVQDPVYPGNFFNSTCKCGYSSVGNGICGLHAGDSIAQQQIAIKKRWLESDAVNNCNTANRYSELCMKTFWDLYNYTHYMYLTKEVEKYNLIQNNDDCSKKIFTSDYWEWYDQWQMIKDKPDPIEDDFASLAGVGALVFLGF